MSFKFDVNDHVKFQDTNGIRSYGIVVGTNYIHGAPHYNIQRTLRNCDPRNLGIIYHVPETIMDWHKCKKLAGSPRPSKRDLDDAFRRAMQGI